MEKRRDVFQAVADPTRREIIRLLNKGTLNLNAVAGNFDLSRPTISEHVKMLEECGLVIVTRQGRERFCEARLEKLREIRSWVDQYTRHWDESLDSLELYLNRKAKKKRYGRR